MNKEPPVPQAGGSYRQDAASGELKKVEGTDPAHPRGAQEPATAAEQKPATPAKTAKE